MKSRYVPPVAKNLSSQITTGNIVLLNAIRTESSFDTFRKILRDFDLDFKYSPNSNSDTWSIKVKGTVVYYNKKWYYYNGIKTRSLDKTMIYLLNEVGLKEEALLWTMGT